MSIPEFYEWQRTRRLEHLKTVRMVTDCFAGACQSVGIFGDEYFEMYLHIFGETVDETDARWTPQKEDENV